jgi:hypothetical protein
MTFNGTRQQFNYTVSATNHTVVFQTVGVDVQLRNSANVPLDTGNASYYAGGWHTIGDTTGGVVHVEMLPGAYSFAMTYNGTREQLNGIDITTSNPVVFQTTLVDVELQAHDNSILDIPNNGSATYYAGGWQTITTLDPNNHSIVQAQMLPGTYSFALTFNGTRDQKTATLSSGATTVYFHAALVTVAVQDHNGDALNADTASYYAGGWHTMVDAQAEMLPGTYSFAATSNGTRAQNTYTVIEPNPNNNANATQTVVFQTGQVVSDSGKATAYYAGGWQPFTSGAELLPGTYTFSLSDQANAAVTVLAGVVNHIH